MHVPIILPDFVLPELKNSSVAYTGIDSLEDCLDKQHFKNFSLPVSYAYNSRGFRDVEWPENLQESVWCLGDSFTVGLGLPFELTWPQQVKSNLNVNTISVSMDGASNCWISKKAIQILQQIQPRYMIIMWSYFHRRESPDQTLSDMARRIHYVDPDQTTADYDDFENCIKSVINANKTTTILHGLIPNCHDVIAVESIWNQIKGKSWPEKPPTSLTTLPHSVKHEIAHVHNIYDKLEELCQHNYRLETLKTTIPFVDYDIVDRARDGHHYGPDTSKLLGKKLSRAIRPSVP